MRSPVCHQDIGDDQGLKFRPWIGPSFWCQITHHARLSRDPQRVNVGRLIAAVTLELGLDRTEAFLQAGRSGLLA